MKKGKTAIAVTVGIFSIAAVFIASVIIAVSNKNSYDSLNNGLYKGNDISSEEFNQNSDTHDGNAQNSTDDTQSETDADTDTHSDTNEPVTESQENTYNNFLGRYSSGNALLNIYSADEGYIEGTVTANSIFMEISAPVINNTVSYSGDDSLGNNISVLIVFDDNNTCTVRTELLVQAETDDYLQIDAKLYK